METVLPLTADGHSSSIVLSDWMPALRRLRELRLRAALTQDELAERAGVARTTILRLEAGSPNPNPRTIRKVARVLKVKPSDLMG
jgi:DNA-binding XRE family transcriptional regulator